MGAVRSTYPRYTEPPVKALSLSRSLSSRYACTRHDGQKEKSLVPSLAFDSSYGGGDLCESRYSDVIARP